MKTRRGGILGGRILVFATLAGAGCGTDGGEGLLLARAESHRLSVASVAQLLAEAEQVPLEPEVVDAVANLWVDYTLLARAVTWDPGLERLDLAPLVEPEVERLLIMAMVDSLVRPDTTISRAQLQEVFSAESVGVEVRARHILLTYPQGFSDEQRDSVRREIEALRERALAGEEFSELAARYSQDPGSAVQGGDLGFWTRGRMVEPFDDAAFALRPGEVSEPVETAYGLHLIKLEERREPSFDSVNAALRERVVRRRTVEAESLFIAEIEEGVSFEFAEEAVELTKRVASNPQLPLSSRASDRTVVRAGEERVTLDDVRVLMQTQPAEWRAQVVSADEEDVREGILRQLAQRLLLVRKARGEGFELSDLRRDSLEQVARERFAATAEALGLGSIEAEAGEAPDEALERVVMARLREVLGGQRQAAPLTAVGFVLRRQFDAEVLAASIPVAVERARELRGDPPDTLPPGPAPGALPAAPADTGGVGAEAPDTTS